MTEYDSKYKQYKSFTEEVEHQLRNILEAEGIVYNAITSRLKDRESLSRKIDRKNDKYATLSDLTDIAGVRVITYYTEDVDKVAAIVEREFVVDRNNSIDKRNALEPDRFGYCSVHYVVEMSQERVKFREYQAYKGLKCEIQIRSVLQHAWAEIEHDLGYKSEIAIPKGIRRNFSRLAGLLEIADKEFQEIRSFLRSYQNEATAKVASGEFQDSEIDAVLLEAIITSNSDIKKLNETIGDYFDLPVSLKFATGEVEDIVNMLHWLNINTVNQLYSCIRDDKKIAALIAKEFSETYPEIGREKYPITRCIALFYLCYAELTNRKPNHDQIYQYLDDNSISEGKEREEAIQILLKYCKK